MTSEDLLLDLARNSNSLLNRGEEQQEDDLLQRKEERSRNNNNLSHSHFSLNRVDSIFDGLESTSSSSSSASPIRKQKSFEFTESPISSFEAAVPDQLSHSISAWTRRRCDSLDNSEDGGEDKDSGMEGDTSRYFSSASDPFSKSNPTRSQSHGRLKDATATGNNDSNDEYEREEERDAYVKSGTFLKRLLGDALRKVAIGVSNEGDVEMSLTVDGEADTKTGQKRQRRNEERDFEDGTVNNSTRPARKKRLVVGDGDDGDLTEGTHASQLAREKIAEVMVLKRELKEEKEHAKGMTHANSALRNASTTTTARMQTLSEALRIAGEKAANARADAEASEVRASSLASQLKNFKNVLYETKRTVETIRAEHDDISSAARDLEAKLLQKESELSRVERQKAKSDKEHRDRCVELKDLKETESLLTEHLGKRNDELAKLKKIILEREHIEKARLEMTDRLEQELRKSRSIIVELTSSAAETESTATELQETIQALQEANESLHDKIKENSEKAEKEKAKLHESLTEAENEAQKLRLKAAVDDEELQKVRLDKNSNEKEVQQLKIRLLAKANSVGVIGPGDELGDVSSLHSDLNSVTPSSLALPYKTPGKVLSTKSPHEQFSIPKLKSISPRVPSSLSNTSASMEKVNRPVSSSNSSSNNRRRPVQTNCSICFKASYGIMKACQCGDPKCALRAHATCISGKKSLPSVSHPGNPSPALPAILCLRKK